MLIGDAGHASGSATSRRVGGKPEARIVVGAGEGTGRRRANVGAARVRSRAASSSPIHAGGCLPAPTYDQRADDVAHHVMQEGVGREVEAHERRRAARSSSAAQRLHRRSSPGTRPRGTREKSCVPTSAPRRVAHRVDVERAMVPADAAAPAAPGRSRAVEQQVGVVARRRGEARVEVVGDRLRPQHRDRGGQVAR